MAFLLNSQAQGSSGKNELSTQTPWRGAQCSCIGLRLALPWSQWCSRDGDLNETSTPRPALEIQDRDFKICAFCRKFFKNVITSELNFFQISGTFPTCFGCFLPANTANKNSLNQVF